MINVSTDNDGKEYRVRLSGTPTNLLIVSLVNYLKNHSSVRAAAGTIGVIALVLGAIAHFLPIWEAEQLTPPLLIIGFFSVFAAALATKGFYLYVGEAPEVVERKEAEEHATDVRDPYTSLDLAIKRLNEYYAINQTQARGSFRWAIFAMLLGFVTIIAGIWLFYLREANPDTFLTSLTTAAGALTNLVSGTFLYLHNKTQKRALHYYGQLIRIQQVGLAIRLAESHEDDKERSTAKNKVIDELLSIVSKTSEWEVKAAARDAE